MTSTNTTNALAAIVRREYRENITFAGIPTAETCRELRRHGFDYDRRTGQWYRNSVSGSATDEQSVVAQIAV